jgi:hypothetical protein
MTIFYPYYFAEADPDLDAQETKDKKKWKTWEQFKHDFARGWRDLKAAMASAVKKIIEVVVLNRFKKTKLDERHAVGEVHLGAVGGHTTALSKITELAARHGVQHQQPPHSTK